MATTKITNPELFDLGSLDTALKLPSGTTAERPTSPSTGEWRYNTTTNLVEFWDGGAWRDLQDEEIPPIPSENFNVVLYTGNGSTQSITGVGFKPDFVWVKHRNDGTAHSHNLADSTRGGTKIIYTNTTDAQQTISSSIQTFDTNGFTVGSNAAVNNNGINYVAWCWKANGGTTSSNTDGTNIDSTVQANTKAGFSIVQFTTPSTFSGSNTVGHGLGATPDMILVKATSTTEDWYVYHTSTGLNKATRLNSTAAVANATYLFGTVNDTVFNPAYTSASPITNIAYCFKSIDGFSKFGSYTGNGSTAGPIVNTGFEPAYIMIKNSTAIYEWTVYDNKRSPSNPRDNVLYPNTGGAENSGETGDIDFLSNGFQLRAASGSINQNGGTIIYAAFAADPSAAPVLADSFANKLYTGNGSSQSISGLGFSPSLSWIKSRNNTSGSTFSHSLFDAVRSTGFRVQSNSTLAQNDYSAYMTGFTVDGFNLSGAPLNDSTGNYVAWNWKANPTPTINTDGTIQSVVSANQAAGFSIVQGTASGGYPTVNSFGHGLGTTPGLIIIKQVNGIAGWPVWHQSFSNTAQDYLHLNLTDAKATSSEVWGNSAPTSSVFSITDGWTVGVGGTFIAYCFAEVSGYSKFGSYTGNGSTQSITGLGFQPSWVLIKETSASESWRVFDSARGATERLFPNTDGAESTAADSLTAFDSDGFSLGSSLGVNENTQTYIYMAFKENPVQYPIASGEMGYLAVAGGGGGGAGTYGNGGGGGAGGLRTTYGTTSGGGASAETNLTLTSGTYTITVGAGGGNSSSGSNSTITGNASISTVGGGAAGFRDGPTVNAVSGGSGGGAPADGVSSFGNVRPGAAGTANEGFSGADSVNSSGVIYGGGGGGAVSAAVGQNGGNALSVSITGGYVYYAGGGGTAGKADNSETYMNPTGTVTGGAGTSQGNNSVGQSAQANTGSGGGGGHSSGAGASNGGSGGSGIVVLRMNTTDYSGVTTGSPTVTTNGSYTILTYTGSGTYVHS